MLNSTLIILTVAQKRTYICEQDSQAAAHKQDDLKVHQCKRFSSPEQVKLLQPRDQGLP